MIGSWQNWFATLVTLSLAGCLGGCKTGEMSPQQYQQWQGAIAQMSTLAKEHGATGYATLRSRGMGGVHQKLEFGLDTGISGEAHLQFNSQNAANNQDVGHVLAQLIDLGVVVPQNPAPPTPPNETAKAEEPTAVAGGG